jgi:hypothetical protein
MIDVGNVFPADALNIFSNALGFDRIRAAAGPFLAGAAIAQAEVIANERSRAAKSDVRPLSGIRSTGSGFCACGGSRAAPRVPTPRAVPNSRRYGGSSGKGP